MQIVFSLIVVFCSGFIIGNITTMNDIKERAVEERIIDVERRTGEMIWKDETIQYIITGK